MPVTAALTVLAMMFTAAPANVAAPGIDVLNVNGSGCRQHTVSVALSPDRTAFTVTYSDYFVQVVGGTRKGVTRDCRLNLRIGAVPGYSPVISSVDHRGFAEIAAGATGQQSAGYRFHGADRVAPPPRTFTGPFSDNWQVTDAADGGVATGECGRSRLVDVDSSVTVTPGTSAADDLSYLATDSTDGVVPSTYHLDWRPCAALSR